MISAIKENCNNLVLMCFCFAETAGACPEQGPEGSESTTHHRCSAVYYPLPRERHFNWLITEREVFAFNTSRAQLITKGAKPFPYHLSATNWLTCSKQSRKMSSAKKKTELLKWLSRFCPGAHETSKRVPLSHPGAIICDKRALCDEK